MNVSRNIKKSKRIKKCIKVNISKKKKLFLNESIHNNERYLDIEIKKKRAPIIQMYNKNSELKVYSDFAKIRSHHQIVH